MFIDVVVVVVVVDDQLIYLLCPNFSFFVVEICVCVFKTLFSIISFSLLPLRESPRLIRESPRSKSYPSVTTISCGCASPDTSGL